MLGVPMKKSMGQETKGGNRRKPKTLDHGPKELVLSAPTVQREAPSTEHQAETELKEQSTPAGSSAELSTDTLAVVNGKP